MTRSKVPVMVDATFKDHFSTHAAAYAARRPTYPDAVADFLASVAPGRSLALDVGCGNGQLTSLLATRFDRVVATDASAEQVASAKRLENVEFRVARAESAVCTPSSVDLLTAAQAAHWFDLPAFFSEARRVLKPGGVVALLSYATIEADPDVRAVVERFYFHTLDGCWPPERALVEEGYRSLAFPFEELPHPPFAIELAWTLDELVGYVGTWSAVRALEKRSGEREWREFQRKLAAVWGEPSRSRRVVFPLAMRVGHA